MRVLLDTHIAIWAVSEPARLYKTERDIIARGGAEVYVSVVSLCEIAIKRTQSRPQFDPISFSVNEALARFSEFNFEILPLLPTHTAILEQLPPLHKDPFDRLLVSQSKAEDATFLTRDRMIHTYLR